VFGSGNKEDYFADTCRGARGIKRAITPAFAPNGAGLPLDDEREVKSVPFPSAALTRRVALIASRTAPDLALPFQHQANQFVVFFVVKVLPRGVLEHRGHHFVLTVSEFCRPSRACLPLRRRARQL
jgi:hypothetical protein